MKEILLALIAALLFSFQGITQIDSLFLTKQECEAIFLKNNLSLLVENIEISKAEAEVIQAKVWPNPTLTIDEVNLWRPKSIKGEEVIPPIAGDFGRNQQFSIGIEQLIITAGKRKKLKALKEIGVAQSQQYFEEVLRNLKVEFRGLLNELNYLQHYQSVYKTQLTSVQQLLNSYKNQLDNGFLNKGEYIRLKATFLSIQSDLIELESELEEVQHELKLLMNLPITTKLQLSSEGMNVNTSRLVDLEVQSLIEIAKENRPEYKLSELENLYAEKAIAVEKAERSPDFSIIGEYNRGDGPYTDFVGFGISIDLPVFNRNKGGIRLAELEKEQAEINRNWLTNSIEKEVSLAVIRFQKSLTFIQSIEEDYEEDLDQILQAYTENFNNRNMSLLEYLDFLEAYLDSKGIILKAKADLRQKAEVLNAVVGKEIFD